MRVITFDIETKDLFQDVGKNDPSLLSISVVGIHDSVTDVYTAFTEHELGKLWGVIERADALVGYNSDHFDIPLLNAYYPGDLTRIKSIDLMKALQMSVGRRFSLGNVASATLGAKKSGHGLDAHRWWKEGEIEKIKAYCLDDVRLTRGLYDFALKNKKLIYRDGPDTREVAIDTSGWHEKNGAALTHTLPF